MAPDTEALFEAANKILELWWVDTLRHNDGEITKVRVLMSIMENTFAEKGMAVRCIPSGERA